MVTTDKESDLQKSRKCSHIEYTAVSLLDPLLTPIPVLLLVEEEAELTIVAGTRECVAEGEQEEEEVGEV